MLAQTANKVGLKSLVIDLYGDRDTEAVAVACQTVPSLALESLKPLIDDFIERYALEYCIYGSGLEDEWESLQYLETRLKVLGNTLKTVSLLQDKRGFFETLKGLEITYPELSFTAPVLDEKAWLIKTSQGQGGLGVRYYSAGHDQSVSQSRFNSESTFEVASGFVPMSDIDDEMEGRYLSEFEPTSFYWQRYQPGTPASVLFLADGHDAQVVGFNTQWVKALNDQQAFVFSGISNASSLSTQQQQFIVECLPLVVRAFALKGLNTLDFIVTSEACFVLEINPRPSASMQLYEPEVLLDHIRACQGQLPTSCAYAYQEGFTGYQVVYAEHDLCIPETFMWPDACVDRPKKGITCRTGQPICSIIAHQQQAHFVREVLMTKQLNLLKGLTSYGI